MMRTSSVFRKVCQGRGFASLKSLILIDIHVRHPMQPTGYASPQHVLQGILLSSVISFVF